MEKNRGEPTELNEKQKKFCEEYAKHGNGTLAYKTAYPTCKKDETAKVNASKLLTNANAKKYVEELNNKSTNKSIATITEIKEFWSTILRNTQETTKERIKASELLAKTYGAFLDKVEVKQDENTLNTLDRIEKIVKKRFEK